MTAIIGKWKEPKIIKELNKWSDITNRMAFILENKDEILKVKRVGRNDPCLCGSGEKSKRCCFTASGIIPLGNAVRLARGGGPPPLP